MIDIAPRRHWRLAGHSARHRRARSPRSTPARVLITSSLIAALGAATVVGTSLNSGARAQSVTTLRLRAHILAATIQTSYDKLGVLDEAYNQAHIKVAVLNGETKATEVRINRAERALRADRRRLRSVAIEAYMNGGSTVPNLSTLLSSRSSDTPMQQTYVRAASGDLAQAVTNVLNAKQILSARRSTLRKEDEKAAAYLSKISQERALARRITDNLEAKLAAVRGSLAAAVTAAERQHQLQAEAASRAAALAKRQGLGSSQPTAPATPPASGGGAGTAAVRAAESQLGVPYVWGGATPGVGFDCSGLTMWAWGQAGVSLAHGATPQYYEIAHVSMSQLQPGDLIFYGGSGYLYHVVMYVGSGPYGGSTVIQAEHSGTDVMFTPMPPGAYGAGRP